jgi:uncharacterized protein
MAGSYNFATPLFWEDACNREHFQPHNEIWPCSGDGEGTPRAERDEIDNDRFHHIVTGSVSWERAAVGSASANAPRSCQPGGVALSLALAAGSAFYAAQHFAIKTDVNDLISPDLPWTQRAARYLKDFPQREMIVVVDAPTPELVEQASAELAVALRQHPDRFGAVSQPGSGTFFERNGLLFLPQGDVARVTTGLSRANDLLGTLAADPSLRGSLDALSLALIGVDRGDIKLGDPVLPMTMAADTVEAVLAGRPASFSWRALADGKPPAPQDLRRFIQVQPVLDFGALRPGRAATEAVSRIASELELDAVFQARVRQTGRIPMDDDEFGTITHNAGLTIITSLVLVLVILWLALRSVRIMLPVVVSLALGLAISAAAGLFLVGAFSLISIAFFTLFVGLGIDFAIQFSVRYRAERHEQPDLRTALRSTAVKAGTPLALAAVAIAVGFASFMPTDYLGLSELGEIAGMGMIIAFLTSITVLPALLTLLRPPGESHPMGFAVLAPVDRFTARHRTPIVVITILVVVLGSPLLLFLPFDFNPIHLQDPEVVSVATYLELKSDPQTGANAIELEAPDLSTADATAGRIAVLPQVSRTRTLSNFVPENQDQKIELVHDAADKIGASLNPEKAEPPPTDQENIEDLLATADSLSKSAGNDGGSGADAARRLAGLLSRLSKRSRPRARTRNPRLPNRCATRSISCERNSSPSVSPSIQFRATSPGSGSPPMGANGSRFCPVATPRTPTRFAASSPRFWPLPQMQPAPRSRCSRPGRLSSTPSSCLASLPSLRSR